uniref:Uncharacterized protein n=1 Tax=Meiothermus ruber TaxID=277 RepID=A0A7C3HT94_MEIRU
MIEIIEVKERYETALETTQIEVVELGIDIQTAISTPEVELVEQGIIVVQPITGTGGATLERIVLTIPSDFSGNLILPHTPAPSSLAVFLNGLQEYSYYLTGNAITIGFQTLPGDNLLITYAR